MEAFTTHTGDRDPAAPQQCRHRPDHPGRLPQADHPDRFRGRPVRRVACRPDLRAEPAGVRRRVGAGRRPGLRHGIVPRARRLGADGLRDQGGHLAAIRRHLPRQLPARAGCWRREVAQDDVELLWKLLENQPGTEVTVDLGEQTISAGALVIRVPDRLRTPSGGCSKGWDDISLTLRHADEITEFETQRRNFLPTTGGEPGIRSSDPAGQPGDRLTRSCCRATSSHFRSRLLGATSGAPIRSSRGSV